LVHIQTILELLQSPYYRQSVSPSCYVHISTFWPHIRSVLVTVIE
jgi:hypothetical protein